MWVRSSNLRCRCPRIQPGKSYLVLDKDLGGGDGSGDYYRVRPSGGGLVVRADTTVIEWKREWRRRMKRFKKRSRKFCSKNKDD